MIIRKAIINDLKRIQELNYMLFQKEEKEFDDSLNMNWGYSDAGKNYFIGKIKDEKNITFVAEDNAKIVGYLAGGICETQVYRNIKEMTELENMFILDEYRSKGIGSSLMREFVEWSKNKGAERIHVEASALNHQAINFYKKNNFKEYLLDLELKIKD
jgi:ribosomal protein S18 acetylase RimI-like enzyme